MNRQRTSSTSSSDSHSSAASWPTCSDDMHRFEMPLDFAQLLDMVHQRLPLTNRLALHSTAAIAAPILDPNASSSSDSSDSSEAADDIAAPRRLSQVVTLSSAITLTDQTSSLDIFPTTETRGFGHAAPPTLSISQPIIHFDLPGSSSQQTLEDIPATSPSLSSLSSLSSSSSSSSSPSMKPLYRYTSILSTLKTPLPEFLESISTFPMSSVFLACFQERLQDLQHLLMNCNGDLVLDRLHDMMSVDMALSDLEMLTVCVETLRDVPHVGR